MQGQNILMVPALLNTQTSILYHLDSDHAQEHRVWQGFDYPTH